MKEKNPFESHNPLGLNQERLDLKMKVAGPEDWQALKKLRQEGVSGSDKEMLNSSWELRLREKIKGKKSWQKDLTNPNEFFVLSLDGSDAIGMGLALQKEQDWWHVGWLYVSKKYQGKGVGKKMTAFRLNQIRERGGRIVSGFIKDDNEKNTGNTGYFGMKRVEASRSKYPKEVTAESVKLGWYEFEIDLTDPEVIKKIDEVLNVK